MERKMLIPCRAEKVFMTIVMEGLDLINKFQILGVEKMVANK
jgi:hypothetical protein